MKHLQSSRQKYGKSLQIKVKQATTPFATMFTTLINTYTLIVKKFLIVLPICLQICCLCRKECLLYKYSKRNRLSLVSSKNLYNFNKI